MLETKTIFGIGIGIYAVLSIISIRAAFSQKVHDNKWLGLLFVSLLPVFNVFTALFYITDVVEKRITEINQPSFLKNAHYSYRLRPITLGEPMVADIWVWTLFGKVSFTLRTAEAACYRTLAIANVPTADPALKSIVYVEGKTAIDSYQSTLGDGKHLGRVCSDMVANLRMELSTYAVLAQKHYLDFKDLLDYVSAYEIPGIYCISNNASPEKVFAKYINQDMIMVSFTDDETKCEPVLPIHFNRVNGRVWLNMYQFKTHEYVLIPVEHLYRRGPVRKVSLGEKI